MARPRSVVRRVAGSVFIAAIVLVGARPAYPDCATNKITAENCLPGNPDTEWDIDGSGSDTIQGFATDISVNRGDTIHFKIDTPSTAYHIDIYRMGYYAGNGARLIAAN